MEDVDYANVIVIEETGRIDEAGNELKYTLVIPEIGEDGAGASKEKIYSVEADSLSRSEKYTMMSTQTGWTRAMWNMSQQRTMRF